MYILKDDWPEKGLLAPFGRELNKLARMLNGIEGFGSVRVHKTPVGLQIYGTAGIDLSLFNFGISDYQDNGTRLVLNDGIVEFAGVRNIVLESSVQLGPSPGFVVMRIQRSGSASWLPNAVSTIPQSNDSLVFVPVYEFWQPEPGVHTLRRIHHLGNIVVP